MVSFKTALQTESGFVSVRLGLTVVFTAIITLLLWSPGFRSSIDSYKQANTAHLHAKKILETAHDTKQADCPPCQPTQCPTAPADFPTSPQPAAIIQCPACECPEKQQVPATATITPSPPPSGVLPLPDYAAIWGEGHSKHPDGSTLQRFWDLRALTSTVLAAQGIPQMQPVLKKLYEGNPIVVVAIGSSVVLEGGAFQSSIKAIEKLVPNPEPQVYYNWNGEGKGWLELFMRYINATWPHPDHILINAGRGGAAPRQFAEGLCLESMLPQHADIFLCDTINHIEPLYIERLFWRVRRHFTSNGGTAPAMIIHNTVSASGEPKPGTQAFGEGGSCNDPPNNDYTKCCAAYNSDVYYNWLAGNSVGLHHDLARYYGWSSISPRDFMWQYVMEKPWTELGYKHGECEFIARLKRDRIHPSRLGEILMADYLWAYLSVANEEYVAATAKEQTDPWSASCPLKRNAATVPEYAFAPTGRDVYMMRCYGFLSANGAGSLSSGADNEGELGRVETLPITGGDGFVFEEWVQYQDGSKKRKPGWVATAVGHFVEIKVDTTFPEHGASQIENALATEHFQGADETKNLPSANPEVVVLYLKSYEHMGKARISCKSGCQCEAREVDAHHAEHTSISATEVLSVTQSKECVVEIRVIDGTSSGEHKFKVQQMTARKEIRNN